jgi:hypothetical protein
MKAIATQIHEAALAANWSAPTARWLPFHASDLASAQQIIASAKSLPETVRAMLMRNARKQTDAQVLKAFRDAGDMRKFVDMGGPALPETFRTMEAFVRRDFEGSESFINLKEAREKIISALAEMDQHIDTAQRADATPANVGLAQRARRCGLG